MSGRKGMKQYPAAIKEEVRKQIAAGRSQKEISREYGISRYRNLTKNVALLRPCQDVETALTTPWSKISSPSQDRVHLPA